jgi:transposase
MSRKRRDRIEESVALLAELEVRHRGTSREQRIRMLRLLKMEEKLTIAEVATILGCSERTAHRWWRSYRQGGIDLLLDADLARRPREEPQEAPERMEDLVRHLKNGDFQTLYDIQDWLRTKLGLNYSIRSISDLVDDQLRPRRLLQFGSEGGRAEIREAYAEPERVPSVAEPMLVFFRSLPLSGCSCARSTGSP